MYTIRIKITLSDVKIITCDGILLEKKNSTICAVLENTKNFSFFYSEVNKLTKNQGQAKWIFLWRKDSRKIVPKKRFIELQVLDMQRFENFLIVWWSLHDFSDMRNDFYFQIVILLIYITRIFENSLCLSTFVFVPYWFVKKVYYLPPHKKGPLTSWIQF